MGAGLRTGICPGGGLPRRAARPTEAGAQAGFTGGVSSVRQRWGSASRARLAGTAAAVATGAALVAGLGGPLAYTLYTVGSTYTGAIPSAGPTVAGAFGGPGGRFGGRGGFPGGAFTSPVGGTGTGGTGGFPGGGTFPGWRLPGGGTFLQARSRVEAPSLVAGPGRAPGTGNGTGSTGNGTFPRFPRGRFAEGFGGTLPGGGFR